MDYFHAIFEEQSYYHIYNRGNNKENLFYNDDNYIYFLEKWNKYFSNYLDVWSYCLMPNHFHFLVKVKEKNVSADNASNVQIINAPNAQKVFSSCSARNVKFPSVSEDNVPNAAIAQNPLSVQNDKSQSVRNDNTINKILVKQFQNFFKTYAQAINKQQNRTGSLFQKKFKRIQVDSDDYITTLIHYIHHNPIHHGFVNHYSKWEYSSYNAISSNLKTKVKRDIILEWFNSREEFMKFHQREINYRVIEKYIVEEEVELFKV